MGRKHGQRLIYVMPNLEEGECEETPYMVKISSDLWAHVFGGPLTDKESRSSELTVVRGTSDLSCGICKE